MDDYDDFEVVFGNNSNIAYEKSTSNDIKQRRRSLDNELFIDRLLKALGVQKGMFYIGNEFSQDTGLTYDFARLVSKSYPAESHENLKSLHEQIVASASPDHHKFSALYYLLKDLQKNSHQSPRDFANASYLPGKYRTFIDGIWYLDRLEFEVYVRYFSVVISLTLAIPKESFRLSHRACTDPYIP